MSIPGFFMPKNKFGSLNVFTIILQQTNKNPIYAIKNRQ